MFHQGDLQSGIASAIQQQKYVACFIRKDADGISRVWEEEWLTEESPAEAIKSKTVLLRIEQGSQEAGFLAAFCPITEAPTLVLINNGTVLEQLHGDLDHSEWTSRLLKALGPASVGNNDQSTAAPASSSTVDQSATAAPDTETTSTASVVPSSSKSQENVQTLLSERGRRLEADRLRREAQEKAERLARNKARQEEEAGDAPKKIDKGKGRAEDPSDERSKARTDWVRQQAQRKEEAKKERERILAQIEVDKQERRNRDQMRRQAVMDAEPLPGPSGAPDAKESQPRSRVCALQIRLFDGSSTKGRFGTDTTLGTGVRTWITETSPSGGADIPYNFRQILAPQPSRSIEVGEEGKTLADLGLTPSATLVLVPVAGYTDAYGAVHGGILGTAFSFITGAVNTVGGALSHATGYGAAVADGRTGIYMGGTADENEPSNVAGVRMAGADTGTAESGSAGRVRVKTLADQRAEAQPTKDKSAEFYNGNSLGFEGKKDDDGQGK